jgi:formylmethanofuran dehydrogenase subunit C
MGYLLELKESLNVPLDASPLIPGTLLMKTKEEIEMIELWKGNRKIRVNEIFTIKEDQNNSITFVGDLRKTRRIGFKMDSGLLTVKGDAGLYVGEEMQGGKIVVEGNVGTYLGSRLSDGEIIIEGNAGDFVGASYRGSKEGMSGGSIRVKGNAGDEVGCWMQGGTIRIEGSCGWFPGIHMINGGIVIGGNCNGRPGAGMTGGKVIILGSVSQILPSFQTSEVKKKVKVEGNPIEGPFYLFEGDINEGGKGKLYINKTQNPHFSWCETLMGEVE